MVTRPATTGPATRLPATTTSPAPPSTTLPATTLRSTTTSGLGATLAITCWELYTLQRAAGSIVRAAAQRAIARYTWILMVRKSSRYYLE